MRQQLSSTRQNETKSLANYAAEIRRLCKRLDLSENEGMHYFIQGLHPDLKGHVILGQPKTLAEAENLAHLKEAVSSSTPKFESQLQSVIKSLEAFASDKQQNQAPNIAAYSNYSKPGISGHDVYNSSHDSSENQTPTWSKPDVQQLLILYKAHEDKFQDPKWKKKAIWKEISKEMNQYGYSYTSDKCQVKFKSLKQNYVKAVDHNNKRANSLKTCSFFHELNEIFACNPFVEPVAECSNRKGYKAVDKKAVDVEEEKCSSPELN